MAKKELAIELINKKINGKSFLSYKDIATATGYHPKYLLKLKKEVLDGTISTVHGNTNRIPVNRISDKEKKKIISLFKKSNVSIRKFCHFYNQRSYSCIYNVLRESGLIKKNKKTMK